MSAARSTLATLRARLADQTARLDHLKAERGELALAAEAGDESAAKRREALRKQIAETETRITDAREAIPAAERAARAETRQTLQDRKHAAVAGCIAALAEVDAEAGELARLVDMLAVQ